MLFDGHWHVHSTEGLPGPVIVTSWGIPEPAAPDSSRTGAPASLSRYPFRPVMFIRRTGPVIASKPVAKDRSCRARIRRLSSEPPRGVPARSEPLSRRSARHCPGCRSRNSCVARGPLGGVGGDRCRTASTAVAGSFTIERILARMKSAAVCRWPSCPTGCPEGGAEPQAAALPCLLVQRLAVPRRRLRGQSDRRWRSRNR